MPKTPQPLEASAGLRPTAPWRGRRRLTSLPPALAWLGTGMGTRRTQPQILHWTRPWTGPSLRTQSRTLQGPALSPGPGDRPQRGWASGGRSVPRGTRKVTWGSLSIVPCPPKQGSRVGKAHGAWGLQRLVRARAAPAGPPPFAAAGRSLLFLPRVGDSQDTPRSAGEETATVLRGGGAALVGARCPCPHSPNPLTPASCRP